MSFDNGPGFTAFYGFGVYGEDVYGEVPEPIVSATGTYNVQNGYCPRYLRFQFSGVNLGLYIFEINPTEYDVYPQRTTQSYKTILDPDLTVDESYIKLELSMKWDFMTENMWQSITPYSRKKVDGTSEILYFWDGSINRFLEKQVKVEAFAGELRGGYFPVCRHNVSVKLREL